MVILQKNCNFVAKLRMRKRTLYIFSLWIATLSILLSTVMTHHHHMGRICMIQEQCEQDGNINDEHTEHHENEQAGCRVHQMHHFIINAKMVKSIEKHILDGNLLAVALTHFSFTLYPTQGLAIAKWQERTEPLSQKAYLKRCRRGPPVLS